MEIRHILFVGLGGAGQRHLRILHSLLPSYVRKTAYRARSQTPLLDADFTPIAEESLESRYRLTLFPSLEAAFDSHPDLVVIANPTALHIPTAIAAAKQGIHVFVEKPLGASLDGIKDLEAECRKHGATYYVAYQRRFHPCFQQAWQILHQGRLGDIVSASFQVASFVPAWHPHENYRQMYAVRADLGGGVILTESHELDLCYWLFGLPDRLFCVGGALAGDGLDIEDTVHILLDYCRQGRRFPISICLSFMQKHTQRRWSISGTQGHLAWDEADNVLRHHNYSTGETVAFRPEGWTRDTAFIEQAKHYLQWLQSPAAKDTHLNDGWGAMLLATAAKRSLELGTIEHTEAQHLAFVPDKPLPGCGGDLS